MEKIVLAIHTPVCVCPAHLPCPSDFTTHEFSTWIKALWDTGANCSCISKRCAEKISLEHFDVTTVATASHRVETKVYLAHLFLPNLPTFPEVELLEFEAHHANFDLIIGMDIISQGDFAITNMGGQTTLSFRIPSLQTIDFELDLKKSLEDKQD